MHLTYYTYFQCFLAFFTLAINLFLAYSILVYFLKLLIKRHFVKFHVGSFLSVTNVQYLILESTTWSTWIPTSSSTAYISQRMDPKKMLVLVIRFESVSFKCEKLRSDFTKSHAVACMLESSYTLSCVSSLRF